MPLMSALFPRLRGAVPPGAPCTRRHSLPQERALLHAQNLPQERNDRRKLVHDDPRPHPQHAIPAPPEAHIAKQMDQGLYIAAHADPQGPVFCMGFTPEPQVAWYAKRTLVRVDALDEARAYLRAQGRERGVVFMENGPVLTHERLTVTDPGRTDQRRM